MTKSHVWLGLCLLMGLALAGGSTDGQEMPRGEAQDGKSISEAGAEFITAFQEGDSDAIFNLLAPWVQDSAALAQARFAKRLEAGEFDGDEDAMMKKYDPADRLELEGLSELARAHPAIYFAFQTGLARLFSELEANEESSAWYKTDQLVGLMDRPDAAGQEYRIRMMPWGGRVIYEGVEEGDSILMLFSEDGDKWLLDEAAVSAGGEGLSIRNALNQALSKDKAWSSQENARAAQGEQMLGSMRNQARVAYSRYGSAPGSLSDADVESNQRQGQYYTVRDELYLFNSGGYEAGIAAEPNTGSDPWLLLKFNYEDGQSEFERFESKEKLDAKIKELQEG